MSGKKSLKVREKGLTSLGEVVHLGTVDGVVKDG